MGHSPSIAELQANNNEFRQYMQGLEKDLAANSNSAAVASKMQEDISAFYTGNHYDDAQDFASGQNTDFLLEKEFSLDNLKKVIEAISAAAFSGAAVPSGSEVNKDAVAAADKALGKEVGAMTNLELYIAGKVFDVLSNVVLSFGTSSSVSYSSSIKNESLGFGLQMFTAVAASSYQSLSFFDNEYIYEYLYMYDVRFSVKQAQAEPAMGLVQAYANQLAVFEDRLSKLDDQLDQGTISPDAYQSASENYRSFIDQFRRQIQQLH
jgi:hypothetical protein